MPMQIDDPVVHSTQNTAEMIAAALRSAIVRGKLLSGQSLRQDEIAAQFAVSKIPVREALVQLQAEGLVRLIPNRGAVVSTLTPAQVDEIYTMRRALEPIALRRAIPHLRPRDYDDLAHLLTRIDHEADLSQWAELNWAFHEALYKPAAMPTLLRTLRDLHHNVVRYLVYHIDEHQLARSQGQHRDLVALCQAADIEAACALLDDHLREPATVFTLNQSAK